jgi:hypothetical protein
MKKFCIYCFSKNVIKIEANYLCNDCGKEFDVEEGRDVFLEVDHDINRIFKTIGISSYFSSDVVNQSSQVINQLIEKLNSFIADHNEKDAESKELIEELKDALVRQKPFRSIQSSNTENLLTPKEIIKLLLAKGGLSGAYSAGAKLRSLVERNLKDKHGFVTFGKQNRLGLEKSDFIKLFKDLHHKEPIKDLDYLEYLDEEKNKTYISVNNLMKFFKVFHNKTLSLRAAQINRYLNLFVHESTENDIEIKHNFPDESSIGKFILESYDFFEKAGLV